MEVPIPSSRCTITEYLQLERAAQEKHEYRDGRMLLMAGGSIRHSRIMANVIGELRARLKGTPCGVYESNLRVRVPRKVLYTYPDITVICGPVEIDPNDSAGETATNPRLIVEVLSPSTEAYDRGDKFWRYRECDSFEEYVLVSQDIPSVETFFRQPGPTWLMTPVRGLESVAKLRSLGIDLPLAEVYAGLEFAADETAK